MKFVLALLAGALAGWLFWKPAPAAGPEPVRYGRETCDHCRMHFAVKGFAAERRDARGALHKYDDLGCLLAAGGEGKAWVEDHDGAGFVPLEAATLVQSKLATPMASGLVAFAKASQAAAFAAEHAGRIVPLTEVRR